MSIVNNLNIGLYNQAHPTEITNVIKELLSYYDKQHNKDEFVEISGYEAAVRSIRRLFGQYCHCNNGIVLSEPNDKCPSSPSSHTCLIPLTHERIFTRLTVLDSLFSTNLNTAYYIKQYITEAIWKACYDGKGGHSDAVLANEASNYIDWVINQYTPTPQQQKVITNIGNLIYGRYPWVKNTEDHKRTALSIMTKYLHFLVDAVHPAHTLGFPIYDSLVVSVLPMVYAYVTGKNIMEDFPNATKSIQQHPYADYVRALYRILRQLKKANNAADVWDDPMQDMTDFHILDIFMWHLGKVYKAQGDYTQLWMPTTPKEFENMLNHPRQIAPHLKSLEDLADKIAAHYAKLQTKWESNTAQQ